MKTHRIQYLTIKKAAQATFLISDNPHYAIFRKTISLFDFRQFNDFTRLNQILNVIK
ncbi:hypothetical protein D3C80_420650 [compost metagenome]|jgi:hypothetical protein